MCGAPPYESKTKENPRGPTPKNKNEFESSIHLFCSFAPSDDLDTHARNDICQCLNVCANTLPMLVADVDVISNIFLQRTTIL